MLGRKESDAVRSSLDLCTMGDSNGSILRALISQEPPLQVTPLERILQTPTSEKSDFNSQRLKQQRAQAEMQTMCMVHAPTQPTGHGSRSSEAEVESFRVP